MSEELEVSLREAVESYLNEHLRAINEEISRLQQDLNAAFARLSETSAEQSLEESPLAGSIAEHLQTARRRAGEELAVSSGPAASEELARLKTAVTEIEEQRSQVDVLNMLLSHATRHADRVALFVIKHEQAAGWRIFGSQETISDQELRQIVLPLTSDTLLSYVARTRSAWSGEPGSNAEDNTLLEKLGGQPHRIAAVPLVVRGKTVAALYADAESADPNSINLDALETLTRVAAMAVALASISRTRHAAGAQAAGTTEPQLGETSFPGISVTPVYEVTASEPSSAGEPVSAVVAQEAEETVRAPEFEPSPEVAAPAVTPMPVEPSPSVISSAPSFGSQHVAPLASSRRWGAAEPDLPIEVSEDERRLHTDARRFARLLVSEIKLYNEQRVNEGRAQGDIYDRLREDIERSRQMYEKRIAAPVAARYDYFHQELVNTLAEGDPAKLGASYPGAMVAVS